MEFSIDSLTLRALSSFQIQCSFEYQLTRTVAGNEMSVSYFIEAWCIFAALFDCVSVPGIEAVAIWRVGRNGAFSSQKGLVTYVGRSR